MGLHHHKTRGPDYNQNPKFTYILSELIIHQLLEMKMFDFIENQIGFH